jgi:uncharacterized protein YpmB
LAEAWAGADTPRVLLLAGHLVPEALVHQPDLEDLEAVAGASRVASADEVVVEVEAALVAIEEVDLVVVEEVDLAEAVEEEASVVGAAASMALQTALLLVPEAHAKVVSAVDAAAAAASVATAEEIVTAAIDEVVVVAVGMIADPAEQTTSLWAAGERGRRRATVVEMVGMAARTRESVGTRVMGMRIRDSEGGIKQSLVRKGLSKGYLIPFFRLIEGKTPYVRKTDAIRQERVSQTNKLPNTVSRPDDAYFFDLLVQFFGRAKVHPIKPQLRVHQPTYFQEFYGMRKQGSVMG